MRFLKHFLLWEVLQVTLFKLGVYNVKHNFGKYFTYFISTLFSVFMIFTFFSIYFNKQIQSFSSGKVKVDTVFKAGTIIVIIFSALFIWYANSFFIKSRKKEMALYSILGMKKKEIGTLLFCENMSLGILSIIIGMPLGAIASKFLLQLLVNLIKGNATIHYTVEGKAVIATTVIFIALFVFNSIKSSEIIYKFKLIELLSAEKESEKAPKGSKIMALIAILMISCGYFIAYNQLLKGGSKMAQFGLIVLILVVAGTYILFDNFIVILLNRLKKSKKLYYKGENLISISQILYRIKANSNLLATIAVISAVAITALGFSFSFYNSLEPQIAYGSPFSFMYKSGDEALNNKVAKIINKHSEVKVTHKSDIVLIDGTAITSKYKGSYGKDLKAPFGVSIMSVSEYNEIVNNTELTKDADGLGIVKDLKFTNDNQCFFIEMSSDTKRGRLKGEKVNCDALGKSFNLNIVDSNDKGVLGSFQKTTIVVTDATLKKLVNVNREGSTVIRGYSLDDSLKSEKLVTELKKIMPEDSNFSSFYSENANAYKLLGSYVFIGMFLGVLFVLSTGSILYYKQLMEAYADKERYNVLRKIGASKGEIRHMVSKQLALIFGLPLLVSLFHSSAALSVYIVKLMGASKLVIEYTLIMIAVYIAIYLCYYMLSVKAYLKIVR